MSSLLPSGNSTVLLNKSFFYRTHSLWNSLPLNIREFSFPSEFKNKVVNHMWNDILKQEDGECLEDFHQSDGE